MITEMAMSETPVYSRLMIILLQPHLTTRILLLLDATSIKSLLKAFPVLETQNGIPFATIYQSGYKRLAEDVKRVFFLYIDSMITFHIGRFITESYPCDRRREYDAVRYEFWTKQKSKADKLEKIRTKLMEFPLLGDDFEKYMKYLVGINKQNNKISTSSVAHCTTAKAQITFDYPDWDRGFRAIPVHPINVYFNVYLSHDEEGYRICSELEDYIRMNYRGSQRSKERRASKIKHGVDNLSVQVTICYLSPFCFSYCCLL